jgi:adenylate cyclase
MARRSDRLRGAVPLLAALLVLAAVLPLYNADLIVVKRLQNLLFDTYQRLEPRAPFTDSPVVILDIDEESLRRIGQWPWPRDLLAAIVERLQQAGVGAIGFDVLFAEPDRTSPARVLRRLPDGTQRRLEGLALPDNDATFARALARGGVVLGQILVAEDPEEPARPPPAKFGLVSSEPHATRYLLRYPGILRPLPALAAAADGLGAINVGPDTDGVIRTVPLFLIDGEAEPPVPAERIAPALGLEVLSVYLHRVASLTRPEAAPDQRTYRIKTVGGSGEAGFGAETGITALDTGGPAELRFPVETNAWGGLRLHYAPRGSRQVIAMHDLIEGRVPASALTGRIVLVGASAAGLRDLRFNTLGEEIPGVYAHAEIVDQILTGDFLTRPDYARGVEQIVLLLLSALLVAVIYRFGALASGLLGLALIGSALGASYYAYSAHQLLFDPVLPSAAALAVFMASSLARYWQTEAERRFIRDAFRTFVSPNLVDSLAQHPEALKLGGTRKECSFVFTDLAGFTSLVERSDPEAVVPLLNEYLDNMVRIGLAHGGYLDKIVGDATVFHFNAFLPPLDQPDHAQRAYACACAMDAWAGAFSARKRAEGIPLNETRIGVNSGLVTVGNFGGAVLDYTAHGDAINTAARLESAGKMLGVRVLVSGATRAQLATFSGRPCGTLILKGQTAGTEAFEPLSPDRLSEPAMQRYLEAYALMEACDPKAEPAMAAALDLAPDDVPTRLHLERLRAGETGTRVVMSSK